MENGDSHSVRLVVSRFKQHWWNQSRKYHGRIAKSTRDDALFGLKAAHIPLRERFSICPRLGLKARLPSSEIFLERPHRSINGSISLDILWRLNDGRAVAIELKYKTHALKHEYGTETFQLKTSPPDYARHDFIKDIIRLENVTRSIPNCTGWAILLTNKMNYVGTRPEKVADTNFGLYEGRKLAGSLGLGTYSRAWNEEPQE